MTTLLQLYSRVYKGERIGQHVEVAGNWYIGAFLWLPCVADADINMVSYGRPME